jgi:hypothetical protein
MNEIEKLARAEGRCCEMVDAEDAVEAEVVDEAVCRIRKILVDTVQRGAVEIGEYVFERFFAGDPGIVRSKNPRKKASFRLLAARCGTPDLPISCTWLNSAVDHATIAPAWIRVRPAAVLSSGSAARSSGARENRRDGSRGRGPGALGSRAAKCRAPEDHDAFEPSARRRRGTGHRLEPSRDASQDDIGPESVLHGGPGEALSDRRKVRSGCGAAIAAGSQRASGEARVLRLRWELKTRLAKAIRVVAPK